MSYLVTVSIKPLDLTYDVFTHALGLLNCKPRETNMCLLTDQKTVIDLQTQMIDTGHLKSG